ncbi:hypothetical protein GCM10009850_099980 [Nonomuraea monospora]|uniref:Uncharacterized protein n=1 Tax=Nonomuraea monospora TaxID=568818 RepID=A0ABN3CZ31_9ACTN
MQVERAARGAGVAGGVAFEDGDGAVVTVHDARERQAGGSGSDYGYTVAHVDTLYLADAVYRNSTMHA